MHLTLQLQSFLRVHMEFVKLLPVFLGLLALTQGGPISRRTGHHQRVLPEIPGYIPVYIQDGDEPPDVALLYQQARAAAHPDINNNADEILALEDPEPQVDQQPQESSSGSTPDVPQKVQSQPEPATEDSDKGTPSIQIVQQ